MQIDYICKIYLNAQLYYLSLYGTWKILSYNSLLYICISIFFYRNHVWGNTYQINPDRLMIIKKMIRIITGSSYRAHTEPLLYANRILTVYTLGKKGCYTPIEDNKTNLDRTFVFPLG